MILPRGATGFKYCLTGYIRYIGRNYPNASASNQSDELGE
jgi:hypothetical protein